jgi:hypothetical protein
VSCLLSLVETHAYKVILGNVYFTL